MHRGTSSRAGRQCSIPGTCRTPCRGVGNVSNVGSVRWGKRERDLGRSKLTWYVGLHCAHVARHEESKKQAKEKEKVRERSAKLYLSFSKEAAFDPHTSRLMKPMSFLPIMCVA